jgi:hypothetical protein
LLEIGRAKHEETVGRPSKETLSQNDTDLPSTPKHSTRAEIAKAAGTSTQKFLHHRKAWMIPPRTLSIESPSATGKHNST